MDPRAATLYPTIHRNMNNNNKPRYRVYSVIRKMNPNQQQQQIMRTPKQEMSSRRYVQQPPPPRPMNQRQNGSTGGGGKNGKAMSSVTIEEVPNSAYLDQLNNQSGQLKVDEDKLPVFLIKLWNIVEDSNLQPIVHWDESGASFHIADPYSFCRNVLPHFFKHNNLNSLIRQLNMYGFRKMTPLSQGGLTRTESDQDHLEFSHPCFVQGRPELLTQIKRKQSAKTEDKQASEQTQQSLDIVMSEMRLMREKAKNMEDKMSKLTKENREMWNQMGAMRQQHARQQQYFKKLLHFLVSVMQPGLSKRVAKRGVLEIDFGANGQNGGTPNSKRARMNSDEGPLKDVCDLLESLQRETQEPFARRFPNNDNGGPLISEVTDEFGNSPASRGGNDMFGDGFHNERVQSSRYSDATDSREASPHPVISQPSSSQMGGIIEQKPQDMYMGSGALTHENVHRSGGKRDYQGNQMTSGMTSQNGASTSRTGQKRAPYKQANRNLAHSMVQQDYHQPGPSNNYNYNPNTLPAQLTYQMPRQQSAQKQPLMAIEDHQPIDNNPTRYSPTLGLSPSLDRQLSQDFQDYFNGMDNSIDSLRDLVNNHNWETFGDNLPEDDEDDLLTHHHDEQNGGQQQQGQYPLALKNSPENVYYDEAGELLDPLLGDHNYPENGFQVPDPNYMPLADEEIFPRSPVLRTPSPSDPNPNLI